MSTILVLCLLAAPTTDASHKFAFSADPVKAGQAVVAGGVQTYVYFPSHALNLVVGITDDLAFDLWISNTFLSGEVMPGIRYRIAGDRKAALGAETGLSARWALFSNLDVNLCFSDSCGHSANAWGDASVGTYLGFRFSAGSPTFQFSVINRYTIAAAIRDYEAGSRRKTLSILCSPARPPWLSIGRCAVVSI